MSFLDTIKNLFTGGSSQTVPQPVKTSSTGITIQGSTPNLQGSSPTLQGSAPSLQGSSPVLQHTVNPALLPASTTIQVPKPAAAPAPAAVPTPKVTAPANPNGVAATPAVVYPDKSNDIAVNQAALAGADTQRTSGLAAIQATLSKLLGGYSDEAKTNEANYNDSSVTNKTNLNKNTNAALVNAAQGRQGLFGILSSLGALSGSGIELANRAVQKGANDDISGANDTFGENQSSLDTNISQFRTADEKRRKDLQDSADASKTDLENQILTSKQKIFGNLASDYAAMNNQSEAKRYSDLIASLFPQIAQTSVATPTLTSAAAPYSAATLAKYVGGDTSTQIEATPATPGAATPGLVAFNPLKKRLED